MATPAPQPAQQGGTAALQIPEDLRQKHPELVELILGSESMNNEERQYWVNILPIMTPEQVTNLRDILLNEKRQLEAIDRKYAKQIQQIGSEQLVKKTEEERRKRRTDLQTKEEQHRTEEEQTEEQLLQQIQNL